MCVGQHHLTLVPVLHSRQDTGACSLDKGTHLTHSVGLQGALDAAPLANQTSHQKHHTKKQKNAHAPALRPHHPSTISADVLQTPLQLTMCQVMALAAAVAALRPMTGRSRS